VRRAAFALWQSVEAFPKGTVFLAVVDPGVGSPRLPVIVESNGYRFIAPDNGLLTYVLATDPNARAWALANPAFHLPMPSSTFHGRDIFAPAAAYAAMGVPGRAFGPLVPSLKRLPLPRCEVQEDLIVGETLHTDRFGNMTTSLGAFTYDGTDWLLMPWLQRTEPRYFTPGAVQMTNGRLLPIVRTFAEIPEGEIAALINSVGLIEIAANRASAAQTHHLQSGETVILLSQAAYQAHLQREEADNE